jgi:hypothetical protein
MHKKKVILVDHNEKGQAADNIEDAEILEIIDHHKLGSLETMTPIYFRNKPLGSTCTIMYEYYNDHPKALPENFYAKLLNGEDPKDRIICDYIAGMSDGYCTTKFKEYFVPQAWEVDGF